MSKLQSVDCSNVATDVYPGAPGLDVHAALMIERTLRDAALKIEKTLCTTLMIEPFEVRKV
jgi:hypothetical protein